jgi:hypothetical protein
MTDKAADMIVDCGFIKAVRASAPASIRIQTELAATPIMLADATANTFYFWTMRSRWPASAKKCLRSLVTP